MKAKDFLLFFTIYRIFFYIGIKMIVPPKHKVYHCASEQTAVVNFYLPFSALFACPTTNLELLLKFLRDKSPPLGSIVRHQSCNCIIFLQAINTTKFDSPPASKACAKSISSFSFGRLVGHRHLHRHSLPLHHHNRLPLQLQLNLLHPRSQFGPALG